MSRAGWVRGGIVALLAALVLGRWWAVSVVERLWAASLGAEVVHEQISEVQSWLLAATLFLAACWFLGNLYLVYRSIGSVHVPRRVGNIEILETLPRHYLLLGFVTLGVTLAITVSHNAGTWWSVLALAGVDAPTTTLDPILQRPIAYYLYDLPWHRTVHRFVTFLAGLGLLVVLALYSAVSVVRWKDRRLHVSDVGRTHLAMLAAILALTLFWGYRLEPAEMVGGIHNVPLDSVLLDIRLPVARGLSGLALLACGASLFWIWIPRLVLVGIAWGLLAIGSFVGHYVAPPFAGSARDTDALRLPEVDALRPTLVVFAYGVTPPSDAFVVDPKDSVPLNASDLVAAPVWDSFALEAFLERTARLGVHERFTDPTLQLLDVEDGAVPVFVLARQLDLAAAADSGAGLDWESVHRGQFVMSSGAVVLSATRASPSGLPLFVPSGSHPDSAVEEVTDVALETSQSYFGPAVTDYAAVDRAREIVGVEPGGLFRRLALAWVLQSPRILRRVNVSDSMVLVWERGVVGRLERYAPFLDFGTPYPVVADGRLYWISTGHAIAESFPGVPQVRWRGNPVRYVRASAVGVIDAATGQTGVYAFREPDLVTRGWLELAPSILRSFEDLPPSLAAAVRYPLDLFRIQRQVVTEVRARETGTLPSRDEETRASEPTWWVGAVPGDSAVRVRRVAVDESGTPAVVSRVFIGSVRRGLPVFSTISVDSTVQMPGPSQLVRRFIRVRDPSADVHGSLRVAPLAEGLVVMQSSYRAPVEEGAVPELRGITIGRGDAVGSGATLAEAIERVGAEVTVPQRAGSWDEARRWFQRLDAARQSGDWRAFGEAYDALRGLFVVVVDSLP